MRLHQLAAKLGINQREIIDFLVDRGVGISENSRLGNDHIEAITLHFTSTALHSENNGLVEPQSVSDNDHITKTDQSVTKESTVSEYVETEPIEVIRARKIKLAGIKVVGKIELPTPLEKPVELKESKKDKAHERSSGKKSKGRKPHSKKYKKTETYEQKLKRQEREKERKKTEQQERLKEKKKQHYRQTVAVTQTPKKTRKSISHEPLTRPKKKIVRDKNPVIRLWKWLNGKYDE